MVKKTAFIGHRKAPLSQVGKRLAKAIEDRIAEGCLTFMMGTHGDFDQHALSACRAARRLHPDLKIEVVLTSYHQIEPKEGRVAPFREEETVLFDVEETHFKRRILISNRRMIDQCDTLICYVDEKRRRSGAKTAMRYAERKGLRIINLYQEEDDPTFGMSVTDKVRYWEKQFDALDIKK